MLNYRGVSSNIVKVSVVFFIYIFYLLKVKVSVKCEKKWGFVWLRLAHVIKDSRHYDLGINFILQRMWGLGKAHKELFFFFFFKIYIIISRVATCLLSFTLSNVRHGVSRDNPAFMLKGPLVLFHWTPSAVFIPHYLP